jgi:protein phosphatase PTC7
LAPKRIITDTAEQAVCVSIEVQDGDIVVAGSDGLFDNIPTFKIKEDVKAAVKNQTLLTTLAKKLADEAIQHGSNDKYESPFAKRAKEQGLLFNGGKLDDTTVIVARIVDATSKPHSKHYETNP